MYDLQIMGLFAAEFPSFEKAQEGFELAVKRNRQPVFGSVFLCHKIEIIDPEDGRVVLSNKDNPGLVIL